MTGVTVHLVDATLDGGPIVAQEAVPVLPGDDEATLHARIHAVEHRLLPRAVALLLAGAVAVAPDGRHVALDLGRADAAVPVPRRALLSVSDKTGPGRPRARPRRARVRARLDRRHRAGAPRRRPAGDRRRAPSPASPRCSTAGSRRSIRGSTAASSPTAGSPTTGAQLARGRRSPRSSSSSSTSIRSRPRSSGPGSRSTSSIEEIDIGGPSMVRAAAKNHASVAIVTTRRATTRSSPRSTRRAASTTALRRALAVEAFAHTAAYDARIAAELPGRMAAAGVALPDEPGLPGASDPYPASADGRRSRRSRRCATARTRTSPRPATGGRGATRGRRARSASGAPPLQGKALSYNNVLDASAAAALGRAAARPGVRHRQAHQPVRRRGAADAPRGVGGRARRRTRSARSAGSWRSRGPVDRGPRRARWPRSSSRSSSRPASTPTPSRSSPTKPNLRVLVDPALGARPAP